MLQCGVNALIVNSLVLRACNIKLSKGMFMLVRCCPAAEVTRLGNDLEEARAALEMQHGILHEQLQRILDEKEGQLQALQDALSVQQR